MIRMSMTRLIRFLVAIACLALGVVVGALNPQPAVLDLGVWHVASSLGVVVLVALLVGVIAGGLALAASVVWPMRQRLRRAQAAPPPPRNETP